MTFQKNFFIAFKADIVSMKNALLFGRRHDFTDPD